MRVLPRNLQPLLTWITGKPLAEEVPWKLRPVDHLLASLGPILAGVWASWESLLVGGWWLLTLPVSWLLTTHGMRKLGSMILHQCTHGTFASARRWDRILGTTIAVLLLTQEFDDYSREHVADHHSNSHMTMEDPTARFIIEILGCHPGLTERQMWHVLVRKIFSPTFHIRAVGERFLTHFHGTSGLHRAALTLTLLVAIGAVTAAGAWPEFLIAWIVPLTVLYNAAGLLRLAGRHRFPPAEEPLTGRDLIAYGTHGIFLGESVPAPELHGARRQKAWARWWLRLLLVHVPARLFVMVGDGPCHDYHHRHPKSPQWVNYPFARRDDIVQGHPNWPAYTEVWGLGTAIEEVFSSLRRADPQEYTDTTRKGTLRRGSVADNRPQNRSARRTRHSLSP